MSELDVISFWVGLLVICWCVIAAALGLMHPLVALTLIVINGACCRHIYRRNVP